MKCMLKIQNAYKYNTPNIDVIEKQSFKDNCLV